MNTIDRYSVSVVPLEILSSTGQCLANATGFFYSYGNNIYLVTNWHVLSGRDSQTGQPRHSSGAIPHSLSFPLIRTENFLNDCYSHSELLINEQDQNSWLQEKDFGQKVDVAVLKLNIDKSKFANGVVNLSSGVTGDLDVAVGIDVFVLGYPRNQTKQHNIPVWKKASIASEPNYPLNNQDEVFLIDCATREGMSGAPVIARQLGICSNIDGELVLRPGVHSKFLGVYSGRYTGDDLQEMQLGIVWKQEHINNIISFGVKGGFDIIQ